MKKQVKRSILCCIFLIILLLIFGKVNASTINLDYNSTTSTQRDKNFKLYPGDEILVSFSIDDNDNEKIMAIYGTLEYDKSVLDIIELNEQNNKGNIQLGDGWTTGNINVNDNTFIFYTADDNRDNVAGYIKFKVKDEIEELTTTITAKNIILYNRLDNNNYKEMSSNIGDVSLNIKINKKQNGTAGKVFMVIIILIVIFVIIIILMLKTNRIIIKRPEEKSEEKEDNKN